MKNKILSLTLILLLCASVLVGCTASAERIEQRPQNQPQTGAAEQLDSQVEAVVYRAVDSKGEDTETASQPILTLCEVCGDSDCDDTCENRDNQQEAEESKNNWRCATCGEYNCDDGKYCSDRNTQQHRKPYHGCHH